MNKCPECGNNDFRRIEGEEVCIACGLVVEDRPLQNPSYISRATINHADQPFLMEAGSKMVNGRIIRKNWIYSTREKNMQSGMNKIDMIASKHKLPEMVITESKLIFKKSLYSNIAKSRGINSIIYASIYIASNIHGVPKTPLEITAYTEVKVTQLMDTYKKIKNKLNIQTKPIDPIDILPRFASKLELTQATIRETTEILIRVKESGKFEGKKPETLLAGAIYIASKKTGQIKTQRKIANTLGIIEATIRKIEKQINNSIQFI